VFNVKVVSPNSELIIPKSYTDLKDLHQKLTKFVTVKLPSFPTKKKFGQHPEQLATKLNFYLLKLSAITEVMDSDIIEIELKIPTQT